MNYTEVANCSSGSSKMGPRLIKTKFCGATFTQKITISMQKTRKTIFWLGFPVIIVSIQGSLYLRELIEKINVSLIFLVIKCYRERNSVPVTLARTIGNKLQSRFCCCYWIISQQSINDKLHRLPLP